MLKAGKRFLFLFHRWSGVCLSVLFGLWFASGFVMMYVGYPELTEEEHFAGLPALPLAEVRISPLRALASAGVRDTPQRVLLSTVLDRPAYRILDGQDRWHSVFADDGYLFRGLDEAKALSAARDYAPGVNAAYLGPVDVDQWSITSSLDNQRPFHKLRLDDARDTELYLSEVTGQVSRDTKDYERALNWFGTTIHWLYPLPLRRHVGLWENLVVYLSLAGTLAALSGMIIGVIRLRLRKRYSRDRMTPYAGVQRLHHILGLVIGAIVLMFIFSGMMSMNPWGVFDSPTPLRSQTERYHGGGLQEDALRPLPPGIVAATASTPETIKEIEWRRVGDASFLILSGSAHEHRAVALDGDAAVTLEDAVRQAAPLLVPDATLLSDEVLRAHDTWYYSHHDSFRPLPVLRVRFDDAENTWFHLDLSTGAVRNRVNSTDRLARWLYNGMHSLDFPFLIHNRPLWDIVVVLLSLVGTAFCVTSVIIGWRRLKIAQHGRA